MARACGEKRRWKGPSFHDDFKGSSGCTKVFVNGLKGLRQVLAVKPGKANWGSVPAVKTPSPWEEDYVAIFSCPHLATAL